MNKQTLAELSQKSGKSVSTVSKVLRGCPGVDAETRTAVLNARCEDRDGTEISGKGRAKEIWMILPDNPKYFWGDATAVIRRWSTLATVRLKIVTRIGSEQTDALLAEYVDAFAASGAETLIFAAHPNEELCRRLRRIAESKAVIQLCEHTPIPNTFFVGANGYADGLALAACLPPSVDRPWRIGILDANNSDTGRERIRGFLEGVGARAEVFFFSAPPAGELYAARLARELDGAGAPLDAVFCNDGITTSVCEALYKLKGRMQARLIGFEYPSAARRYAERGQIAALAIQDIAAQTDLALTLANRYLTERVYPERKMTYLPSEVLAVACV